MRSFKKNWKDRFGKKRGYWEHYHSDGNIKSKGLYKDGKREGYWEFYYSNGNLVRKGLYNNGVKIKNV